MKRIQAAVLIAAAATAPVAAAPNDTVVVRLPHYRYVALQRFMPSGPEEAFSINAAETIVGITNVGASGQGARWTPQGRIVPLGAGSRSPYASSSARKITDRGLIVGQSGFDDSRPPSAAIFNNGHWVNAGTGYPDKTSFSAFQSANDAGSFVGIRSPLVPPPDQYEKFRTEAFVYRAGRFTTITLGGKNGQANDVNASGVVVGHSERPDRTPSAFSWHDGKIVDLGASLPAALTTDAIGINSRGDVVGQARYLGSRPDEAVAWAGGKVYDLGRLGGSYGAEAFAVNDARQVVGRSSVNVGIDHGFLFQAGRMYDLNAITTGIPHGTIVQQGTAIAADGAIVGEACVSKCDTEIPVTGGFLLEPIR